MFFFFFKHGIGTELWTNGSKYIGNFQNNQKNGEGKLFFADGSSYQGNFTNNVIDGFGIY